MFGISIRTAALAAALILPATTTAAEHSHTRSTEKGHYRITLTPVPDRVPIAELHSWTVYVETKDGVGFSPERLGIAGGMPTHGHGLPSEPRVTQKLDNGSYLIEGMKFHMGGEWQLVVGLSGPLGFDRGVFDISISNIPTLIDGSTQNWSDVEIALLQTFALDRLPDKADHSNRFSGDKRAAVLGKKLFFDKNLSASGTISCASCHLPQKKFTDGMTKSFGTQETARHSPSLIGAAYNKWFYWDGRRDSLWAQAVTPIETPGEMDNTRVNAVRHVTAKYGDLYEEIVGDRMELSEVGHPLGAGPYASAAGKLSWHGMRGTDREAINRSFSNIGKILAAYIEQLRPAPSRFDHFVTALTQNDFELAAKLFHRKERAGLRLFIDGARTQCIRCHNGPLFTNHEFHNIATGIADNGRLDFGRAIGLQAALVDEFNCRGKYSDAAAVECSELRFASAGHESRGAFKVPGLRNVAVTAPYMHDGRFDTLQEVLHFYTQVPDSDAGPHELPTLELSADETEQLAAFLATLTGSPDLTVH